MGKEGHRPATSQSRISDGELRSGHRAAFDVSVRAAQQWTWVPGTSVIRQGCMTWDGDLRECDRAAPDMPRGALTLRNMLCFKCQMFVIVI